MDTSLIIYWDRQSLAFTSLNHGSSDHNHCFSSGLHFNPLECVYQYVKSWNDID